MTMKSLFNSVDSANQIIPRLWLGDFNSSQDLDFLKKNRIMVIVNCTKDLPFLKLPGIFKYRVPVHDNLEMTEILSMTDWIEKILPLIDHHYQKGRTILIHCAAGMQRSAIITLSYLYNYHTHNAGEALYAIKSRRPIVFTPFMNFKLSFCKKFGNNACKDLSQNNYGVIAKDPTND
jgi:dual specificity phosphatase 12